MTEEASVHTEIVYDSIWKLAPKWGVKKLSDIAKEMSHQVKPSDNPSQIFNYWSLDAISKGQFQEPEPNFVAGSAIESTCVEFGSSQILYCKLRPYLNKVIVPSVPGIGSTEWVVIQPDEEIVNRSYLAYVLRSQTFLSYVSQGANIAGARMPRLRKEALWRFDIPLPYPDDPAISLRVQRAIVARIEALLGELREIRELHAAIDRDVGMVMESVLETTFQEVVSNFSIERLSDYHPFITSGPRNWGRYASSSNSGPLFLRVGNIGFTNIEQSDIQMLNLPENAGEERARVKQSDVILTITGTVGRCAVIPKDFPIAYINQHNALIRLSSSAIHPRYLMWYLLSPYGTDQTADIAYGQSKPGLNLTQVKELTLPIPSEMVQKKIVNYLDSIYLELREMKQTQSADDQLFTQVEQSILEQAFRGEL